MTATALVSVVDDDESVRESLPDLLKEFGYAVQSFASAEEFLASGRVDETRCLVLDIAMPNLNGIEAARQVAAKLPRTAIVILSMHADESYVLRALKAGARAYLLKDSAEADLINAIRAVNDGKAFFSPAISKMLVDDYMRRLEQRGVEDSYELLTTREREILQLLAEGKANKEVATILNLSLYTVETHRGNILQKLNLHSVPELILYAVRKGVIS